VIYISLSEIKAKISDDWLAMADQALADVIVITDPQKRAQAINDRDDVWKALRERLAALRKDKSGIASQMIAVRIGQLTIIAPKTQLPSARLMGATGGWHLPGTIFVTAARSVIASASTRSTAPRAASMITSQYGRTVFGPRLANVVQMTWNAKSQCCLIHAAKLTRLSSGSMKTVSLRRIPIYAEHRGLFFTNAS
jgi:hypothetical protein